MENNTCRIATARMDYHGHPGQRVLNTTVQSGAGLGAVFAPTWAMVMAWKRQEITWEEYRQLYTELMRKRYREHQEAFFEVLAHSEVVICCYCKDTHATTQHCHRYLLVQFLEKIAHHYHLDCECIGEVSNGRPSAGRFSA